MTLLNINFSKQCKDVGQTNCGSRPITTTPINKPLETFLLPLQINVCTKQHNDKFGDKTHKITVKSNSCLEEEENVLHKTPIFLNNKTSLVPHLKTYKERLRYNSFPFTFHQITSLQTIYTLIALQLISIRFEPCNGQQSSPFYLRDNQEVVPQYLQTLNQPYEEATSTTSGMLNKITTNFFLS